MDVEFVLSSYSQSKTSVVKVKGVSFNYVQFLWNGIGQVKQAQAKRAYSDAITIVTELISYLPDSIKEDFRTEALKIQENIRRITGNNLPQIKKIPDFYMRGIYRNRLLQTYSAQALDSFIDRLTTKLNALGYMESVEHIQEGEDDWYAQQRREQTAKKQKETRAKRTKEADKFSELP